MIEFSRCDALTCPNCGGECLHHRRVVVNDRTTEDGPGIRVAVDSGNVYTRRLEAEAPEFAGRRDDLAITFWCENCAATPVLGIKQHKGSTYVEWLDQ